MKPQGLPPKLKTDTDGWFQANRARERQRAGKAIAADLLDAIHPREETACECLRERREKGSPLGIRVRVVEGMPPDRFALVTDAQLEEALDRALAGDL